MPDMEILAMCIKQRLKFLMIKLNIFNKSL